LPDALGEAVSLGLPDGESDALALRETLELGVTVTDTLGDAVVLSDELPDAEPLIDSDADGDGVSDTVTDAERDTLALADTEPDADTPCERDAVLVLVAVGDARTLSDGLITDTVCVADVRTDADVRGDDDAFVDDDGVLDMDDEPDADGDGVGLFDGSGVADSDAFADVEAVTELERDADGEMVCDTVDVGDALGVRETRAVPESGGVAVASWEPTPRRGAVALERNKVISKLVFVLANAASIVIMGIGAWQIVVRNYERTVLAWSIAAFATSLACYISFYDVHSHLRRMVTTIQRHYVRILFMVPLYAVESWIALRFKDQHLYFETLREMYDPDWLIEDTHESD
jgi:hypothetical protein